MLKLAVMCCCLLVLVWRADGSMGDASSVFHACRRRCMELSCPNNRPPEQTKYEMTQPLYMRLLGWTCSEECKYECMWHTVDMHVQVYKEPVPQFYGKWPFIRLFGMQEPASVVASLLNLIANVYMLLKMRSSVARMKGGENNRSWRIMKRVYYSFAGVCINTWLWSAIFHTKDTNFTEKMDYFCAFALTLIQLTIFFARFFVPLSLKYRPLLYVLVLSSIVFYIRHIAYLGLVNFDYGYNMSVNIKVGVVNSICWLVWSFWSYRSSTRCRYVWRCAFSVLLFDALMIFEVFDFSPLWWTLDSHAMWHFSTIVVPFYWYQFLIDDLHHLAEQYEKLNYLE